MASVIDILNKNKFSFSAEIIPPRNGSNLEDIFLQIEILSKNNFDFVSVTHGAGGSLRGGTLPICHFAQDKKKLVSIAHLTCRSFTKEDLENNLIDHHYFQINNILALRGDPPDGLNAQFQPVVGGFSYAHQLIKQISNMNQGKYLVRKSFDIDTEYREGKPTSFCIGAASYPEDYNLEYLKIKKDSGAHFSISQMIYDIDILKNFYKESVNVLGSNFPIIPGFRIPTSYKQLLHIKEKFNISVPSNLLERMQKANNISEEMAEQEGLNWTIEFVKEIQKIGYRGVHLFIMNKPKLALELKKNF